MSTNISKILREKNNTIFEKWMSLQLGHPNLREDLISREELTSQSKELLEIMINSISETNLKDMDSRDFDPVYEVLSEISISRARLGFSPSETGHYIYSLKKALIQIVRDELSADLNEAIDALLKINALVDNLAVVSFETFIKGREEIILRQTDEINEISTPVIRVWDGILALPIIGTLDSSRTQTVMENLLQEIVTSGSTIAILDISGVPAVDSMVAQHLIKTVSATRLMGAECIISGIRPEIAQTVVHLGIDLSNIVTKSSLANALKHAFALLKLEVKKNQKPNA